MMEAPGILKTLRNTSSPIRAEFLQRLQHLTPGRMCLMLKYLLQHESDAVQILSEYFGVALAFVALGALIPKTDRANAKSKDVKKFERMAFESMLKGAMKRLRELALHANRLEEKVKEATIARDALLQDKETFHAERMNLLKRVKETEAEIMEMRNIRLEDTKDNERAVAIFASREQSWNNEKKRLMQEIESLKRDVEMLQVQIKVSRRKEKQDCKECEKREGIIADLSEKLRGWEFLVMASVEEEKIQQHERSELCAKLAIADMIASDLREDFTREVEQRKLDYQKFEAIIAEMTAEKQAAQHQVEKLRKEIESLQVVAATCLEEKSCHESSLGKFSKKLISLEQQVRDKEKMIAAMLQKDFASIEERNRLAWDLTFLRMKAESLERQTGRWKLIAEGRDCTIEQSKTPPLQRSRGKSLDSKLLEIAEVEKVHVGELRNMHSMYKKQIDTLQNQLNNCQEKIVELEEVIFLHLTDGDQGIFIKDACEKGESSESRYETMSLRRGALAETGFGTKVLQLSTERQQLVQCVDKRRINRQEVDEQKKLYFAAKRTVEILEKDLSNSGTLPQILELEGKNRYLKKLDQRHLQEIDAFQRQMRAKDERMEAFRRHLILMELESQRAKIEIEHLKNMLQQELLEAKKLQRGEEITSSMPVPKLLAQQPYYCDSNAALTTISDDDYPKKIFMEMTQTDPEVMERMQTINGMPISGSDKPYDKVVAEILMEEVESVKRDIGKLPSSYKEILLGFQGEFLANKDTAGFLLENLSTKYSKMDIKNVINATCLELERLLKTTAETKEQLLQVENSPGDHFRQLVDHAAKISRSGEVLRKLKSLLSGTGEMQEEQMFRRCKASQQECKELEGQYKTRIHEREAMVSTAFPGQLLPVSSKELWEKRASPAFNLRNQAMSSASTRPLLNLMAADDGRVTEEYGRISTSSRVIKGKRDSGKSTQNLQVPREETTTVEASNRLKILKQQIFG